MRLRIGSPVPTSLGARRHLPSNRIPRKRASKRSCGSRREISAWPSVALGATVAISHTIGVLILAAVALVATEWLLPDRIVDWLMVVSALLVVVLGVSLVIRSFRLARSLRGTDHGSGAHAHPHTHPHPHPHPHGHTGSDTLPRLGRWDAAMLGLVGGLVPSGSALLLLLSSIALERVAWGIVLLVAFGVGMALVLVLVAGAVVVLRGSTVAGWDLWDRPWIRRVRTLGTARVRGPRGRHRPGPHRGSGDPGRPIRGTVATARHNRANRVAWG